MQTPIARSVFVQATVGGGTSTGGTYAERDEYNSEFMLGYRPLNGKPIVVGASVGQNFVNGSDLTCANVVGGVCGPLMPRFGYAAVLVGVERPGNWIANAMAGPAFVRGGGSAHAGGQVRAELGTPSLMRMSLVVSPRLLIVPSVAGETLNMRSVSVGLRYR